MEQDPRWEYVRFWSPHSIEKYLRWVLDRAVGGLCVVEQAHCWQRLHVAKFFSLQISRVLLPKDVLRSRKPTRSDFVSLVDTGQNKILGKTSGPCWEKPHGDLVEIIIVEEDRLHQLAEGLSDTLLLFNFA